jgi:hypothetical protein
MRYAWVLLWVLAMTGCTVARVVKDVQIEPGSLVVTRCDLKYIPLLVVHIWREDACLLERHPYEPGRNQ